MDLAGNKSLDFCELFPWYLCDCVIFDIHCHTLLPKYIIIIAIFSSHSPTMERGIIPAIERANTNKGKRKNMKLR